MPSRKTAIISNPTSGILYLEYMLRDNNLIKEKCREWLADDLKNEVQK